ncbi:MAG: ImmA/IrrE family metallo-endopeptidase [Cognatishimia activa]
MQSELDIVRRAMENPPVDVAGIIRNLGITYISEPMTRGKSGFIEHENGKFTIRVNSSEAPQRRKFTAAHELAHYLLHREMLVKKGGLARHSDSLFDEYAHENPYGPFTPSHEVEANQLAAEIIMPKSAVRENYDELFDNYDVVAELFGVSQTAMKIRLKTLGLRRAD